MTKLQALRTNNCNNIKGLNSGRFYLIKKHENAQLHKIIIVKQI